MILYCWVVTHRETHDDEESLVRSIKDFSTNAQDAWVKFLGLAGRGDKKVWVARGYVARRVCVQVSF